MKHYIGLDVSLKTTSICVLNEQEKIIKEACVATDPKEIAEEIAGFGVSVEIVGVETGGISHWLVKELKKHKLPVICIDARKMAAAISIRTNKTDKNDAREIANALRAGYYKEVHQKLDTTVDTKTLLTVRRALVDQRTQTINCMRGILRAQGKLDCGSSQNKRKFIEQVKMATQELSEEVKMSINALLHAFEVMCNEIDKIEEKIESLTKDDEDIKLFKTIPGVGSITALTYKLEIDDPKRFKKSRSVGAFAGMTPRQYSSGDTQKQGCISKTGSNELRMLLSESAMRIIYKTKLWSRLKLFGMKIRKKHGHKKAVVALGRKLAVVMHRMWIDRKPFEYGKVEEKEAKKVLQPKKRERKSGSKIYSEV